MKNNIIIKLCGAAAVLACASTVQATPTLFLWDSTGASSDTTVVDQGAGDLNLGASGVGKISFIGTVGNWDVSVAAGLSKPAQGTAVTPDMDLQFGDKGLAAGTIHIAFFDNAFGPSGLGGALASIGGTFPGGLGVTLTYSTFTQGNNNTPTFLASGALDISGFGSALTTKTFTSGAALAAFGSTMNGGTLSGGANPYSLLQVITITTDHAMGSATTGDSSLTVPDGGMTLMLLGSSLTGLAFLRRSSKAKA